MDSTAAPDLSSPTLPSSQKTPTKKGTRPRMSPKKRKRALEIDDITSMFGLPADDFKATLQALVDSIDTEKTLAPSSLDSITEALKLFNLRESDLDPFTDVQVLRTPQILEQNIDMVHLVTSGSPRTEALSRTIIDQILIYCLYEQIQQSNQQPPKQATDTDKESHRSDQQSPKQATDTDKDSSHMPPRTSDTDTEDPAVLELLHETCLSRVVTHKGETKRLYGFADYSIWYDSTKKGKEALATNLLIVEAKRRFYTDAALPQLASYMGIVHASRKDMSKENCVVYGIASDGWTFRFCRIDNDGVFVSSDLLQWTRHKDRIYSIIRSLLQAAALSSPSTTPIKDPMRRKVVLASFGSPERTRRFDYGYGYGRFRIYEGDELENVEIVRFKPYWR